MMGNVIPLQQPVQKYVPCAGCGAPFARLSIAWTLCPTCYHWSQSAWHRDRAIQHRHAAEVI